MPGILIVEPEVTLRRLLWTNLTLRDYTVITVEDPLQAFPEVVACEPDVVILDMAYNNQDSRTFLDQLTTHDHLIPVVVMTTSHHDLPLNGHNVKHIISKPFPVEVFLNVVSSIMMSGKPPHRNEE